MKNNSRGFMSISTSVLGALLVAGGLGHLYFKDNERDKSIIKLQESNDLLVKNFVQSNQENKLLSVIDSKMTIPVDEKVKLAHNIYSMCIVKQIPINIVCGLIDVESGWNPKATSETNAKGLMQLMPFTAKPYLRNERIDYNPNVLYDSPTNVLVGISYVSDLHDSYVESKKENSDDFTLTLHSYYWGSYNSDQLYGSKEQRVNVPNMSYPNKVIAASQKYKDMGL